MNTNKTKLLAGVLALAVFTALPFGVWAKSQNASGDKGKSQVTSTDSVQYTGNQTTAKHGSSSTGPKVTANSPKSSPKAQKPQEKNGTLKRLAELESKLNSVEKDTNKITVEIDTYIKAIAASTSTDTTTGAAISTTDSSISTTGSAVTTSDSSITTSDSAITTTGSAITTTGSAIKLDPKSRVAFVNSSSGKLKALSNRLSAVEKSLKSLPKKLDSSSSSKYSGLLSKLTAIKTKITKEIELLKTIKVK